MTVTLPSIAILGAGSMGGAILSGLRSPGVSVDGPIVVTNRSRAKAEAIGADDRVTSIALEDDPDGNRRAAAQADIVLVGVKPAMVPELLEHIAGALRPGTVVVSLAAGVTCARFEAILPESVAVVRSMPNTPSTVGLGVTGLSAGSRATPAQLAVVEELFGTVGEVIVVPEAKIDALSTFSGSGPAYVFYLIEQFVSAAQQQGFTREQAETMIQGTFRGATALLASSGLEPEELRRRVTSPKGTTERAVAVLEQAGLDALFVRASDAALARAREMAAE
ncbi:pyrroline-5-carboxylate reductase [Mycetocola reblochoni]|uniref:Pyrroline-5-carboxylate reductase n=2 Tax=Mycetocola reblochoni TaxID=331618 RepID=A0A1R4IXL4_9MICO|nr:pyrroline-5-carboxylate reductase [Mycetocola reblochoni]RLP70945.1 pyrroline-5-carboxylate reductase [Mycetocola reblochoni]SJN24305.1 Pyrroline-5-carboxylate reductase [Mycetocola reblochoni REB411]